MQRTPVDVRGIQSSHKARTRHSRGHLADLTNTIIAAAAADSTCCLRVAALQSYAAYAGPACPETLLALLTAAERIGCLRGGLSGDALADVTPLHLLACWTPENKLHSTSRAQHDQPDRTTQQQRGMQQHMQAVELLLQQEERYGDRAADVDAVNSALGDTPLAYAAAAGALEVAQQLLLNGADVNLPRRVDAARPIDLAVNNGHYGVACLLLEHGAEVSARQQQQQQQSWQQCRLGDRLY